MVKYFILMIFVIGMIACSQLKKTSNSSVNTKVELSEPDEDSTEYDVIIFDPGFESWFIKNRKLPAYHTNEILAAKNWNYVSAWNIKVSDGNFQMRNPNNPFDQEIDYRRNIDYGMDVNYKLYYYFKYVEESWGKF